MIARSHRTFQRWIRLGLFEHLWAALLTACAALGGVNREWQAADAARSKARLGGMPSGGIPPTGASLGEAQAPGRGGWRAARGGCGRGQRPGHQALGGHAGGRRGGASPALARGAAAPVLG